MPVLILLQEFVYIFLTARLLFFHSRHIKANYSSIEKVNLAWIRNLLILLVIVSEVYSICEMLALSTEVFYLVPLSLTVFIFALGFINFSLTESGARAEFKFIFLRAIFARRLQRSFFGFCQKSV